jgi:hypothetical protein
MAVRGLTGRFGKPIRVRLGIRLDPFLGVSQPLYTRRGLVPVEASNQNINLLGLAPFIPALVVRRPPSVRSGC